MKMMMIPEHFLQQMPSPRQNRPFGCFSEQVLKIPMINFDPSKVSLDRPPLLPGRYRSVGLITFYSHILPILPMRGGGGVANRKGAGAGDSQVQVISLKLMVNYT
jgi:hypothetical protein